MVPKEGGKMYSHKNEESYHAGFGVVLFFPRNIGPSFEVYNTTVIEELSE